MSCTSQWRLSATTESWSWVAWGDVEDYHWCTGSTRTPNDHMTFSIMPVTSGTVLIAGRAICSLLAAPLTCTQPRHLLAASRATCSNASRTTCLLLDVPLDPVLVALLACCWSRHVLDYWPRRLHICPLTAPALRLRWLHSFISACAGCTPALLLRWLHSCSLAALAALLLSGRAGCSLFVLRPRPLLGRVRVLSVSCLFVAAGGGWFHVPWTQKTLLHHSLLCPTRVM